MMQMGPPAWVAILFIGAIFIGIVGVGIIIGYLIWG